MKKYFALPALILTILFTSEVAIAQSFPKMDSSPMDLVMARPDKNSTPYARVIYSRPQKKGRTIFGDLIPFGKLWRAGANNATSIDTNKDLLINGQTLPAGKYECDKIHMLRDNGKRATTIWLAKELNYVPVKIRHNEKGDIIEMQLKSYQAR